MKNKLLALGAIIAAIAFGFMLIRDPGHIPLLDANRQVLVETQQGGYCAGRVFGQSNGRGSIDGMIECREAFSTLSTEYDHSIVQREFCRGFASTYPLSPDECITIMKAQRLWPVKADGTLTLSWNRKFPYPLQQQIDGGTQDDSRTGDRDGIDRTGEIRP